MCIVCTSSESAGIKNRPLVKIQADKVSRSIDVNDKLRASGFKCASRRRNVCWETLKTIIVMYPEIARFAVISYNIPVLEKC